MFSLTNILLGMFLTAMWVVAACSVRSACTMMRMPKPGLAGAMTLVLVAGAGSIAVQFALGMMTGMSAFGFSVKADTADHLRLIFALPVWMLVSASVYKCMLPTTFGKATMIFLGQALLMAGMILGLHMLAHATHSQALLQMRGMMPF